MVSPKIVQPEPRAKAKLAFTHSFPPFHTDHFKCDNITGNNNNTKGHNKVHQLTIHWTNNSKVKNLLCKFSKYACLGNQPGHVLL